MRCCWWSSFVYRGAQPWLSADSVKLAVSRGWGPCGAMWTVGDNATWEGFYDTARERWWKHHVAFWGLLLFFVVWCVFNASERREKCNNENKSNPCDPWQWLTHRGMYSLYVIAMICWPSTGAKWFVKRVVNARKMRDGWGTGFKGPIIIIKFVFVYTLCRTWTIIFLLF